MFTVIPPSARAAIERGPDGSRTLRTRAVFPAALIELIAVGIALGASLLTVSALSMLIPEFMYSDGDSVLPALMAGDTGHPEDWALSPVLFLPERWVYNLISLLSLGTRGSLFANGVVNFLSLYLALRLLAGGRLGHAKFVLAAMGGYATVAMLALLEASTGSTWLLAGLLGLATYYYPTLLAIPLTAAVVRLFWGRHAGAGAVILAVLAFVSAGNNPLYVLWCGMPLAASLLGVAVVRQHSRHRAVINLMALVIGCVAGYSSRAMFSDQIVAATGNYLRPNRWLGSLEQLSRVLEYKVDSLAGLLWLVVVSGMVVATWCAWRRSVRRECGRQLVITSAAVIAIPLIVGCYVLVGSDAWRYLQPLLLWPIVAIVASAETWRLEQPNGQTQTAISAIFGALSVISIVIGGSTASSAALNRDADLICATRWIDERGAVGGGQYWSVRGPQAYVRQPELLVQVTHLLQPYDWLSSRASRANHLYFLITTDRDAPYAFPASEPEPSPVVVDCGRYSILDFGRQGVPAGRG